VITITLIGCSDNEGDKPQSEIDLTARTAINNGYLLESRSEYASDGSLIGSNNYNVDYGTLEIASIDTLQVSNPLEATYRFDAGGDLQSIQYYVTDSPESINGSESISISFSRENGVLSEIFWDYKIGNESDLRIQYGYDDNGLLSNVVTTNIDTQISATAEYYYNDDGQLTAIVEEDLERPEVPINREFTWRDGALQKEIFSAGLVTLDITYTYDDSGNVSSISTADSSGNIQTREEFTYSIAAQPVFNLILEGLYYSRQ